MMKANNSTEFVTITLKREVRDELRKVAGKRMMETGKRVTMQDVIKEIIEYVKKTNL